MGLGSFRTTRLAVTSTAGYLAGMGRFDEAIAEAKQGQTIDPLSPNSHVGLAYSLNLARRYDEAIDEAKKALDVG